MRATIEVKGIECQGRKYGAFFVHRVKYRGWCVVDVSTGHEVLSHADFLRAVRAGKRLDAEQPAALAQEGGDR